MTTTGHEPIERTVHKTYEWLNGVSRCMPELTRHEAYSVLRAVLHALRDRLSVKAVAGLGAQLPTLIRGIYYEGWRPTGKPLKLRHLEEFLALVATELTPDGPDPEDAARAVFRVIQQHIGPGETDKLIHQLPRDIQDLWQPEAEPRDT